MTDAAAPAGPMPTQAPSTQAETIGRSERRPKVGPFQDTRGSQTRHPAHHPDLAGPARSYMGSPENARSLFSYQTKQSDRRGDVRRVAGERPVEDRQLGIKLPGHRGA